MELVTIWKKLNTMESLLLLKKNVLNLEEVSQLIGLSKSTLYKLTCTGKIPHYKKAKHLFFDRLEVESWLKSNRIKTADELDIEASTYVTLNHGGQRS